ncbi:MAG: hypothetical protein H6835_05910 [Planctomycetes bacterium]|nr:hypothetical protein [Planctomycetota bacterium]
MIKVPGSKSFWSAITCSALLLSCAGPERATRASTEGLADGANDRLAGAGVGDVASNGGGAVGREAWQTMTKRFADDLIAATADLRGAVAVFPALARTPAANRWASCGIGDRIAQEIVLKLQAAGRQVLAEQALRAAIEGSNRGLDALVDEDAAIALAERLAGIGQVAVAVTGTIDVVEGRGFGGGRRVEFALRATNVRAGGAVRRADATVEQPAAVAATVADLAAAGAWRIGAAATPFQPSVDREFDVLTTAALARILDRSPELVFDRRVAVMPLELDATGDKARALASRQRALESAIDTAERKAKADGASDPLQAALDGPLTVAGTDYPSGSAALQAYYDLRQSTYGVGSGALAADLGDSVAETLRGITGDRVTIVAADDRRLAVGMVQADSLESRTDGSVAGSSIAFVESQAADVVVTTRLRQRIEDYVLRVRVFDLADPNRGRTETVTLAPWVVEPLKKRLGTR